MQLAEHHPGMVGNPQPWSRSWSGFPSDSFAASNERTCSIRLRGLQLPVTEISDARKFFRDFLGASEIHDPLLPSSLVSANHMQPAPAMKETAIFKWASSDMTITTMIDESEANHPSKPLIEAFVDANQHEDIDRLRDLTKVLHTPIMIYFTTRLGV